MKEIKMTGGYVAVVDDEDFDIFNKYSWSIMKSGSNIYAKRLENVDGKRVNVMMHRVILSVTDRLIKIDHRNRNGLDNQRKNLRIATPSQNSKNKKASGKSKYLGVSIKRSQRVNKWVAQIKPSVKDKRIHLGYFKTQRQAAIAYNIAAVKYHKEFANLNIV